VHQLEVGEIPQANLRTRGSANAAYLDARIAGISANTCSSNSAGTSVETQEPVGHELGHLRSGLQQRPGGDGVVHTAIASYP